MIIQVQQLIKSALQDIGSVAKSEMPTSDEMTDGLTKLNFMIDAWAVRSLMVLRTVLEAFPLTSGKYAYTIGTGGDFNTPRPTAVTDAYIRDGNGSDTPVDILSSDEYYAIEDKSIGTGRPQGLWFDPGLTQAASALGNQPLSRSGSFNPLHALYGRTGSVDGVREPDGYGHLPTRLL